MKKLLFGLLLFSCTSPSLESTWSTSNFYNISDRKMISSPLPFQTIHIQKDSVWVDGEGSGLITQQLSDGTHLIFAWKDTTRYFLVKTIESNLLILETNSFVNGNTHLLTLKR